MNRIFKRKKNSFPLLNFKKDSKGFNWSWSNFKKPYKPIYVKTLFKEQGGVCAYCTRRLDISNCKIEHIYPRCFCNEYKKLSHSNMVLVCNGTTGRFKHCDTYRGELKASKQLMTLNPTRKHKSFYGYKYIYYENGKLKSSFSNINSEIEDKLNLNCDPLVDARLIIENTYIETLMNNGFDKTIKSCKKELARLKQRKNSYSKRKYDDFIIVKINVLKQLMY